MTFTCTVTPSEAHLHGFAEPSDGGEFGNECHQYRYFDCPLGQRAAPASVDAISSVAARSFGVSASVMRPTSPYLKVPPLAHSTTSPMACFLVVATRRAAVRNSLRSWLNPELPLPLLGAGEEVVPLAWGLATPFPPETLVPFVGGGVSPGEFN